MSQTGDRIEKRKMSYLCRMMYLGFALLISSFASLTAVAQSNEALDWYRNNNKPLPQIQLANDKDAPETDMFQRARTRALLAQTKFELATGNYWTISEAERKRLIGILDDPSIKLVYTGKRGTNTYTGKDGKEHGLAAAAQTIDGKSINLHHATFAWDSGPNKDNLLTPFDIASTIFHETVHISLLQQGILELLHEPVARAIEGQFNGGRTGFDAESLEELERYAGDPAGYKPQNEGAETPETAEKPTYDPTNLKAAFAVLEIRAQAFKATLQKLAPVCTAIGSKQQIDARVNQWKNEGVSLPTELRSNLLFNNALRARLELIRAELEILKNDAAKNQNAVCRGARQENPNLDSIKASATNTQTAAASAKDLLAQAEKIASKLNSDQSVVENFPSQDNFVADQSKKIKAAIAECTRPSKEFGLLNKSVINAAGQLEKQAAQAYKHLLEAETKKYADSNVFRGRYAAVSPLLSATSPDQNAQATCFKNEKYLRSQCGSLKNDLLHAHGRAVADYADHIIKMQNERQALLANLNKGMSGIRLTTAQIYRSALLADNCVATAQANTPNAPDPATTAAATRLGDFSAVACNVSAINTRISELRDPQYTGIPSVGVAIQQLEANRTFVNQAQAALGDARTSFNDGKPQLTRSNLERAREALGQLNGMMCPQLTASIDKGERDANGLAEILSAARGALRTCSADQLSSALRQIGDKMIPAKLVRARDRISRQLDVLRIIKNAEAAYARGDKEGALALMQAAQQRHGAGGGDCPPTGQRIRTGLATLQGDVDGNRQDEQELALATGDCNVPKLTGMLGSYRAKLGSHAKVIKREIETAIKVCQADENDRRAQQQRDNRQEEVERARESCIAKKGLGYHPSKINDKGIYHCIPTRLTADAWCRKNKTGPGWSATQITATGTFGCQQSLQDEARIARGRQATCLKKKGPDYYPGKADSSGNYYCIPTRQNADAWCRKNNKGSGWSATTISARGGHGCRQSRQGVTDLARAYCLKKEGRGYYPSKPDARGNYNCIPTRQTADAWCRKNNKGTGWSATTILARGGHGCRQSRRSAAATARTACRREYGSRLAYVDKKGKCHFCDKGWRYNRKTKNCYQRGARQSPRNQRQRGNRFKPRYKCTVRLLSGGIDDFSSNNHVVFSDRDLSDGNTTCRRIR